MRRTERGSCLSAVALPPSELLLGLPSVLGITIKVEIVQGY